MPEDTISPTLRHRPRSLTEFRAELAARLAYIGDNGASMFRSDEIREWIAILDAEIAQRQRAA